MEEDTESYWLVGLDNHVPLAFKDLEDANRVVRVRDGAYLIGKYVRWEVGDAEKMPEV